MRDTITDTDLVKLFADKSLGRQPTRILCYLMLEAGLRISKALPLAWLDIMHNDHPVEATQIGRAHV